MEACILLGELFVPVGDLRHEGLKVGHSHSQPRQLVLFFADQLPVACLLFGSRSLMSGQHLAKSGDFSILLGHRALVAVLQFGDLFVAARQLGGQWFKFGQLAAQFGEFRIPLLEPHQ